MVGQQKQTAWFSWIVENEDQGVVHLSLPLMEMSAVCVMSQGFPLKKNICEMLDVSKILKVS